MTDENVLSDVHPRNGGGRVRPEMPADAFEVRRVPLPVGGRDREVWKISILVLILSHCRSNSATLEQVNVLMWAVKDEENAARFQDVWQEDTNFRVMRALDDSLAVTMRLGMAEGLFEWGNAARVKLTTKGTIFAEKIVSDKEIFVKEKAFLTSFKNFSASGMWSHLGEITPAQLSHLKDF